MDQDILQERTTTPRMLAVCIGLSLLLHAGVLGILWSFQFFTQVLEPLEVINVHLLEIQNVSKPSPNSQASSTQEAIPLMKNVSRTRVNPLHAPFQKNTSFTELPQVILRSDVPAITQVLPLPRTKTSHAKKPPLLDHLAQNALMAKDLLKVIPHVASHTKSFIPLSQPSQFLQQDQVAAIPHVSPPFERKTAKDRFFNESRRSMSSRRILSMKIPKGEGAVEKKGARLAQSIPPVYPRVAREEGWEGIVVLRVRLHKDGTPKNVSVKKTSGHEVLDQAALKAIYGWSFVPARDGNIPIPSLVDIPVRFNLTSG